MHSYYLPIIHRDIKPSNVIVTNDGIVKLLDMNAAKYYKGNAEEDTHLIGTVGYAAPEQYGFGESSVQTDIYALGVLLNYLIVGDIPKKGLSSGQIGRIVEKTQPLIRMAAIKMLRSFFLLSRNTFILANLKVLIT